MMIVVILLVYEMYASTSEAPVASFFCNSAWSVWTLAVRTVKLTLETMVGEENLRLRGKTPRKTEA